MTATKRLGSTWSAVCKAHNTDSLRNTFQSWYLTRLSEWIPPGWNLAGQGTLGPQQRSPLGINSSAITWKTCNSLPKTLSSFCPGTSASPRLFYLCVRIPPNPSGISYVWQISPLWASIPLPTKWEGWTKGSPKAFAVLKMELQWAILDSKPREINSWPSTVVAMGASHQHIFIWPNLTSMSSWPKMDQEPPQQLLGSL